VQLFDDSFQLLLDPIRYSDFCYSVMRPMRRTCAQHQRAGSFDLVVALDTEMWNHRRSHILLSIAVAGKGES